jgi:hypothetical protein
MSNVTGTNTAPRTNDDEIAKIPKFPANTTTLKITPTIEMRY